MDLGVGVFSQLLGWAAKFAGQYQATQSRSNAINEQARAYEFNAAIAQQNSQLAIQSAASDRRRQERISKLRLSSKAGQFLKSGVTLSGSPLAVLGDEAIQEALAAEDITHAGSIRAAQHQNTGALQSFYAQQARNQSDNVDSQGLQKAGFSLLGTTLKAFN